MYRCQSWTRKKTACWRIDAFELWFWKRLLRIPGTERRSNQSILKEIQPWIFIRMTNAEAPVFWPPDVKSWLIGKVPEAGKDWGQEEKGATEKEMVGWHHQCNGHELGQSLGDSEGQGGLACCSPWGHKESDMTGWLNNNMTVWILTCSKTLWSLNVTVFFDHSWPWIDFTKF